MTESPNAIEARGLTKSFSSFRVLNGIDLAIAAGESVALFGPNGAGKTTLVRLLTMGLKPNGGTLRLAGKDPRRDGLEIRRQIGVISHSTYLYDDLSARENLEFYGSMYGVDDPGARAAELLDLVGLAHRGDDPVGTFSRGMQQRAAFARALVHDPAIVFLDEPFSGLDPHAANTLRHTLDRLRDRQRTLLLVTHNLTQGLDLSDRWLLLDRGHIVDQGRSAEADRAGFESNYFERVGRRRGRRPR